MNKCWSLEEKSPKFAIYFSKEAFMTIYCSSANLKRNLHMIDISLIFLV